MRVHKKKKSNGVRVDNKKERWDKSSLRENERWGES